MTKIVNKEKIIKFVNAKMFIVVLVLILILITLLVGTYAWFTWSSTDNTSLVLSIGDIADVRFEESNQIDGKLSPVFNYTDGLSTNFSVINKVNRDISFNISLKITSIDSELISKDVKYKLFSGEVKLAEGDLSSASNGSIISMYDFTLGKGSSYYKFYLYMDGNEENDLSMMNKSIVGSIMITTNERQSLVNYIKRLYTSGNPELITQEESNDSYYYSYQDTDKTWGLMNDGLTIDTTQDATTTGLAKVVTDTTALTSGTQGNIRYFGPSNSVNNYLYFNCDTYPNTNCELWRIIGIVDGKVKIIKDESIGDYSWDWNYPSADGYSNNWSSATLNSLLNDTYYRSGTTTYYSNSTTGTTVNFATTGITEATRTGNLISESIWYLGGYSSSEIYPNDIYNYERQNIVGTTILSINPFTINANIGLMYASDYGFGTDLSKCSKNMSKYDNSANSYACRTNNWLFNSAYEWLINPYSLSWPDAWRLNTSGSVASGFGVYSVYGVRPVLYLKSELAIELGHAGTSIDPYRISVS